MSHYPLPLYTPSPSYQILSDWKTNFIECLLVRLFVFFVYILYYYIFPAILYIYIYIQKKDTISWTNIVNRDDREPTVVGRKIGSVRNYRNDWNTRCVYTCTWASAEMRYLINERWQSQHKQNISLQITSVLLLSWMVLLVCESFSFGFPLSEMKERKGR